MTNRSYVIGGFALLGVSTALAAMKTTVRGRREPVPAISASFLHAGKPLVLVVLKLKDCGTRIEGLRQLNRFASTGDVDVRGVILDAENTSQPLAAILDGSGIQFPVTDTGSRQAQQLLELTGYRRTPLLFAFNKHGELRTAMSMDSTAMLWSSAQLNRVIGLAKDSGGPRRANESEVEP